MDSRTSKLFSRGRLSIRSASSIPIWSLVCSETKYLGSPNGLSKWSGEIALSAITATKIWQCISAFMISHLWPIKKHTALRLARTLISSMTKISKFWLTISDFPISDLCLHRKWKMTYPLVLACSKCQAQRIYYYPKQHLVNRFVKLELLDSTTIWLWLNYLK